MADLVCLGEPLYELNAQPDGTFRPGFGGDVSNVAVAAARQGCEVRLLSAIGDDHFGDALAAMWAHEGVLADSVERDPEHETGLYFVIHDESGHRFLYRRRGSAASQMASSALSRNAISSASVFYSSGISLGVSETLRDTTFDAVRIAAESGVRVAFDPNLRTALWPLDEARAVTHRLMKSCDIALPSLDDARRLTGQQSPEDIVTFYHELGAETVALTLGHEGVAISSGGACRIIPGVTIDATDATGAGDCFNGIFLANLISTENAVQAAERANFGAAISTTGLGALNAIPTKDSLTEQMETR